jgi:hypothetical protein
MNEPEQPSPSSDNDTVDPIAADPVRDGTTIVFAGDPAQVRAGFLLALQLLGLDALMPDSRTEQDQ